MGLLLRIAFLGLLAALLVPAGSATASTMQFGLPASNGYTLQVKTERTQTIVSLRRGGLSSIYYVSESAGPEGIVADLGPLGRIDVRFQPSGETRTVHVERGDHQHPGCRFPRRLVRALGTFTGTISFHGENGFTAVEATQVRGSVGPSSRPRCQGEPAEPWRAPAAEPRRVEHIWIVRDAVLAATSRSSDGTSGFTILFAYADGDDVRYAVDRIETPRPGLTVHRTVDVTAPRSTFSYSGDLTAATLRPPAPFSGEATYSARRGRLSGDLVVEFPGVSPQPLTGPGFDPRLDATH
ncbi:MAG TPA: hypothetical protein VD741_04550 [Solirubrobacterales bacterium]|nr:hypothetical protein [Solirubrobacterales bacterium]